MKNFVLDMGGSWNGEKLEGERKPKESITAEALRTDRPVSEIRKERGAKA